jgi:hypothetical protein
MIVPDWLKRFLFLLVTGVTTWLEEYYIAPLDFGWSGFVLAMVITVVLAVGWMRTYWNG